jgi:hypothetical protein
LFSDILLNPFTPYPFPYHKVHYESGGFEQNGITPYLADSDIHNGNRWASEIPNRVSWIYEVGKEAAFCREG